MLALVVVAAVGTRVALDRALAKPTESPFVLYARESDTVARLRAELSKRRGPKLYSFNDEELLIRDFFDDARGGYFVDVGASHYEKLSNTYYLEKHLGWRGLAIDAQTKYAADYARYRPNTHFVTFFVGDRQHSGEQAEFFVDLDNEYASSGVDAAAIARSERIFVPTITLDELLEREGSPKVDFVTMDIEDAEPAALAGFTLDRWRPRLVCVEMHLTVKHQVIHYFRERGYAQLESYAYVDWLNGYFAPADDPAAREEARRYASIQADLERERSAREQQARHKR